MPSAVLIAFTTAEALPSPAIVSIPLVIYAIQPTHLLTIPSYRPALVTSSLAQTIPREIEPLASRSVSFGLANNADGGCGIKAGNAVPATRSIAYGPAHAMLKCRNFSKDANVGLLTVTRRENESICLTVDPDASLESIQRALKNGVVITVYDLKRGKCKLQVAAPNEVNVMRAELLE